MDARHRVVVDRDRRVLRAADGHPLSIERELGAGRGAGDHHEAVGPIEQRRRARVRGGGARRGLLDVVRAGGRRRSLGRDLVLQDDPVVTNLNEIAVREVLRVRDAQAVHEDAVVAREILEDDRGRVGCSLAVLSVLLVEARVQTRHVALGQPDRVPVFAPNRVLVARERHDGLFSFVVLDGQLPHWASAWDFVSRATEQEAAGLKNSVTVFRFSLSTAGNTRFEGELSGEKREHAAREPRGSLASGARGTQRSGRWACPAEHRLPAPWFRPRPVRVPSAPVCPVGASGAGASEPGPRVPEGDSSS